MHHQVSHGAIQFAVYEELKHLAAAGYQTPSWLQGNSSALRGGGGTSKSQSQRRVVTSSEITAAGALSKLAASIVTYPFQVVRARLQQRQARALRYGSAMQVARLTLRREGIQGFYKVCVLLRCGACCGDVVRHQAILTNTRNRAWSPACCASCPRAPSRCWCMSLCCANCCNCVFAPNPAPSPVGQIRNRWTC